MKFYSERYPKLLGIAGGVVAFNIALIYFKVTPAKTVATGGFQKTILLYGHSFCWILLGGASILWTILKKNHWSQTLAYIALASYLIFILTLLPIKFT